MTMQTAAKLTVLLSLLFTPSAWAAKEAPLRVFLLAGQSNMEGQGVVEMDDPQSYNGGKGNLVWSMANSTNKGQMAHLKDAKGQWTEREDVEISFKARGKLRKGPLTIGYTGYGGRSHIGPELQFGHVVGEAIPEPILPATSKEVKIGAISRTRETETTAGTYNVPPNFERP